LCQITALRGVALDLPDLTLLLSISQEYHEEVEVQENWQWHKAQMGDVKEYGHVINRSRAYPNNRS